MSESKTSDAEAAKVAKCLLGLMRVEIEQKCKHCTEIMVKALKQSGAKVDVP